MIEQVLTIGAHGFDQRTFFEALRKARADLLIDVRARRGVRGREYAFANSARLQAALATLGIAYAHARELAPSDSARRLQYAADDAAGVGKRTREQLSPKYIAAYTAERLRRFDPAAFAATYGTTARRPVLFCVERLPGACHRSLLADRLHATLGVPIKHLLPP